MTGALTFVFPAYKYFYRQQFANARDLSVENNKFHIDVTDDFIHRCSIQ